MATAPKKVSTPEQLTIRNCQFTAQAIPIPEYAVDALQSLSVATKELAKSIGKLADALKRASANLSPAIQVGEIRGN